MDEFVVPMRRAQSEETFSENPSSLELLHGKGPMVGEMMVAGLLAVAVALGWTLKPGVPTTQCE